MHSIKRMCVAAISVASGLFVSDAKAEVYYLNAKDVKPTALSVPGNWQTSSGTVCKEILPNDDFVCQDYRLFIRPPDGGNFAGGSLSIGGGGTGNAIIYLANNASVGFPDYGSSTKRGLVFHSGRLCIGSTGGTYGTVNGVISVESAADAPFSIINNIKDNANSSNPYTLEIAAALKGAADTVFQYASAADKLTLTLTGDSSGFAGTLMVTNLQKKANINNLGVLSSYGGRLLLDTDSAFGGKIVLNGGNVLECETSRSEYEIGALDLRANAVLVLNSTAVVDSTTKLPASTRCPSLRVTRSVEIAGPVVIALPGLNPVANGCTNGFAVLSAPAGSDLSADDFTLGGCAAPHLPYRFAVVEAEDGRETLFLEFEPYAVLLESDDSAVGDNEAIYPSAMTNSVCWSDGKAPRPGVNYVVRNGYYIRTPTSGRISKHEFTFPGRRLIMCSGSSFISHCAVFRSSDMPLRFYGGTFGFVNGQSTRIEGGLEAVDGELSAAPYRGSFLDVDVLSGDGRIKTGTYNRSDSVAGYYRFRNTENFTGTVDLQQTRDPRAQEGYYRTQFLMIDGDSLGGRLAARNFKALRIANESALVLPPEGTDQTLADNVNRGIFVDGIGRVELTNATSRLRIDWPLTMNGKLWKQGDGTLELGGGCKFGASASEMPAADGNNEIHLQKGCLAVAASGAVDGCRIVVSNGTEIAISYSNDNAELTASGLRNVKVQNPFELCGIKDGKLPLCCDFSKWAGEVPDVFEFALLTVASDAAAAVRAMVPDKVDLDGLAHPYRMEIFDAASPDGTAVTFKAKITRVGFRYIVR